MSTEIKSSVCQHFRISINLVTNIPQQKQSHATTLTATRELHAIRNVGTLL